MCIVIKFSERGNVDSIKSIGESKAIMKVNLYYAFNIDETRRD